MDLGELKDVIANIDRPIYGVAAWDGGKRIAGWGTSGEKLTLHLSHRHRAWQPHVPWVDVDTTNGINAPIDKSWMVRRWMQVAFTPFHEEIEFPITFTAETWDSELVVDARRQPFVFVGQKDCWVADGDVAGRRVSVQATNLSPDLVELATVSDESSEYEIP